MPIAPLPSPRRTRTGQSRRLVALPLFVALLGGVLTACVPDPTTEPLPADVEQMDDAELDAALRELAPDVTAALSDPEFQADIPEQHRAEVNTLIRSFGSPDGRTAVAARLRAAAVGAPRGLPNRAAALADGEVGDGTGVARTISAVPTPRGSRDGKPPAATGTSATVAGTSGPCNAPDGVGELDVSNAPGAGGQLITPQHDVFTAASAGTNILVPGRLSPTGQEPFPGQGPGVQFRGGTAVSGAGQTMKVQIHLQDPKGFGPRALMPIIRIRPVGGTASDEYQVLTHPDPERPYVRDARILCYAGDTDTARGYYEAWIPVPRTQPGFQVIVEVVENDYWFATQPVFPRDAIAVAGPQYYAGGDRSTVHVGDAAVTSAQPIPRSIGAFASAGPDRGDGSPNVVTDTNGNPADDLEQPIRRFVNDTVKRQVADALAGDLFTASLSSVDLINVQAEADGPLETSTDLRVVDPSTEPELQGVPISGELPGSFRAIRADIAVGADVTLNTSLLGVSCYNQLTARVDADVDAWVWADAMANSTGMTLRLLSKNDSEVDLDLPAGSWLNPTCVLSRALGPLFYEKVDKNIRRGVASGLAADPDNCPLNPEVTPTSGRYGYRYELGCPAFASASQGTLGKLLAGLDLNSYLPGIAGISPVVTNLDNAWCGASGAPSGCSHDMSVIGTRGLQLTADATLLRSLGDALGAPLGGRFRNVYAPPLFASVNDVVVSHRDADGRAAGLGVVVDPRTINLALRHLVQGSSTTRTTNGLLDISGVQLGPLSLSVRPEVAPMMIGMPTPDPVVSPGGSGSGGTIPSQPLTTFVFPDQRIDVTTAPGSPPVRFAVSATADVGVGFDSTTGQLLPIIENPVVDLQLVTGCQADYVRAYGSSYLLCGRAGGGSSFPSFGLSATSVIDIVDHVVNDQLLPTLGQSIGGLKLPDLTGILPGLNVALENVRSSQRGSHLAVYADLKSAPRASIAISEERRQDGSRILRYFPSNLTNLDVQNVPTNYAWEVRDAVTDQVLTTTEFTGLPPELRGTNYAVQLPVDALTEARDNIGQYRATRAKLTITQPSSLTTVVAEGTYRWAMPTPPPPSTCSNGPVNFLVAAPTGPTEPPRPCA